MVQGIERLLRNPSILQGVCTRGLYKALVILFHTPCSSSSNISSSIRFPGDLQEGRLTFILWLELREDHSECWQPELIVLVWGPLQNTHGLSTLFRHSCFLAREDNLVHQHAHDTSAQKLFLKTLQNSSARLCSTQSFPKYSQRNKFNT